MITNHLIICKFKIYYLFKIRDIEKQLLDNILISTSITTKPSDLQLKDYLNRSKNLNKSNIIHNLRSKLELFINNKNTKGVIVSKYYYNI